MSFDDPIVQCVVVVCLAWVAILAGVVSILCISHPRERDRWS